MRSLSALLKHEHLQGPGKTGLHFYTPIALVRLHETMWHRMCGRSKCFVGGHMLGQAAEYWMATLEVPRTPLISALLNGDALCAREAYTAQQSSAQYTDLGISCCCFEI